MAGGCPPSSSLIAWLLLGLCTLFYAYSAFYCTLYYADFGPLAPWPCAYQLVVGKPWFLNGFHLLTTLLCVTSMWTVFNTLSWLVLGAILDPLKYTNMLVAAAAFVVTLRSTWAKLHDLRAQAEKICETAKGVVGDAITKRRLLEESLEKNGFGRMQAVAIMVVLAVAMVSLFAFILLGIRLFQGSGVQDSASTVVQVPRPILSFCHCPCSPPTLSNGQCDGGAERVPAGHCVCHEPRRALGQRGALQAGQQSAEGHGQGREEGRGAAEAGGGAEGGAGCGEECCEEGQWQREGHPLPRISCTRTAG